MLSNRAQCLHFINFCTNIRNNLFAAVCATCSISATAVIPSNLVSYFIDILHLNPTGVAGRITPL